MATVYLARDERHNRNVALKVLRSRSWPRWSGPSASWRRSRRPRACSIRISCRCSIRSTRSVRGQELRLVLGLAESDQNDSARRSCFEAARITSRLGVRAGLQHERDDFASIGLTCAGLISPGVDCGPDLRSEEARTTAWYVDPDAPDLGADGCHSGTRDARDRSPSSPVRK
jgi:hypothetical protein